MFYSKYALMHSSMLKSFICSMPMSSIRSMFLVVFSDAQFLVYSYVLFVVCGNVLFAMYSVLLVVCSNIKFVVCSSVLLETLAMRCAHVNRHMSRQWTNSMVLKTEGQCSAGSAVDFPAYVGTKFD